MSEDHVAIDILARDLEARGIESLFVGEHTHTPVATETDSYHDAEVIEFTKHYPAPLILLAVAAGVTTHLRVGTSVCLPSLHDPLIFAKEIATLDVISGGRVELGCGYGWNRAELSNHGIDPRLRRTALRESLEAMNRLWTQDTAEFSGKFASFSSSWSWPKPVQRPRPPVLIGAPAKPAVFRDIIELADGWMPSSRFTDAELAQEIKHLRHAAGQAGRSAAEIRVTLIESRALTSPSAVDFIDRCPPPDRLRRWCELGIDRVVIGVPTRERNETLTILDHLGRLGSKDLWLP